jgi:hypothetical protein
MHFEHSELGLLGAQYIRNPVRMLKKFSYVILSEAKNLDGLSEESR